MKVAVYSGSIPSTTFIERLIVGLAESGIEVLLHGKINKTVSYDAKNIKIIGYRGKWDKFRVATKYATLFAFTNPRRLIKLVKSFPRGNYENAFTNWFVIAAPIVWHQPDIFHLQWAKDVESFVFLRDFGIKLVLSLRGSQINYSPVADEKLAVSYRKTFPVLDGFHGVSREICREAAQYGADFEKCAVVYSGLDLREFPFEKKKKFGGEPIKIISIGRSHWVKGYNLAIDAMKILADQDVKYQYRIVGGKGEELIYQVNDLGLEELVKLENGRSFEEVKTIVADSDILLMSSVEEGMPNVILEAMALGTIVISTDCGGVSEVIEDGANGFLVPIRNARAIADKVSLVSKLAADELDQIRQNARGTIEQQHNYQKMVDDMIKIYRSLK